MGRNDTVWAMHDYLNLFFFRLFRLLNGHIEIKSLNTAGETINWQWHNIIVVLDEWLLN